MFLLLPHTLADLVSLYVYPLCAIHPQFFGPRLHLESFVCDRFARARRRPGCGGQQF